MTLRIAGKLANMSLSPSIAVLVLMLLGWFVVKLIKHRQYFRRLRAQGLPMPPHSFLFGHALVLANLTKLLPKDAYLAYLPYFLKKEFPELGPDIYLDLWPFTPCMLIVGSPEALQQTHIDYNLPKSNVLQHILHPLTNGLDIVSANGPLWKQLRSTFNPGFSGAHLMTLVPVIVKEVQICCQRLEEHVSRQDIFSLKPFIDSLTLDIIGRVVLDVDFDSQREPHQALQSLRTQINWLNLQAVNRLREWLTPMRYLVNWYHGRIADNYIMEKLDKRIERWQKTSFNPKEQKTIIDLALKSHLESKSDGEAVSQEFKKFCVSQFKIFIFAGFDTVSSAICWTVWFLSEHPDVLKRVREEHNQLLGPDPAKAAEVMSESPHLVGQLRYTTAVIKEALRLSPPSPNTRAGDPNIKIIDSKGRAFPLDKVIVWPSQHAIHRDSTYWPEPNTFNPDRFLVEPGDPLHPVKGMWRPFEVGPRSCMGTELALMDMRIALVLLLQTYNVRPAYDELDAKSGKKDTAVMGLKPYQVTSMHPRGDLPVRIDYVNQKENDTIK